MPAALASRQGARYPEHDRVDVLWGRLIEMKRDGSYDAVNTRALSPARLYDQNPIRY